MGKASRGVVFILLTLLFAGCGEPQANQAEPQQTVKKTVEVTETKTVATPSSASAEATAKDVAPTTYQSGRNDQYANTETISRQEGPDEAQLYAQLDEIPIDGKPRERLEFGRDIGEEIMQFESCVFQQSTNKQMRQTQDLGVGNFDRVRALYEQGACVEEFNLMMDAAKRDIYISVIEAQQYLGSL